MTFQLGKLGGAALWGESKGGTTKVAVLDSGVRASPGLPARRLESVTDRGRPTSRTSGQHGHNCACLIASELDGAMGVAPEARVLSVRVTTAGGAYTKSGLKRGLRVALDAGCDVISCSFTLPRSDRELAELVREAHMKGVVVLAATGNKPSLDADFPHLVPHAVVVGAVDAQGKRMRGKVTEWTDVFSLGEKLDVASPNGSVKPWNGQSSGATALVAGVVALALAPFSGAERVRRGQLVDGALKATATRSNSSDMPSGVLLRLDALAFIQSLGAASL